MNDKQLYWDETRQQYYWIEWSETGNNDIPYRHYIKSSDKEVCNWRIVPKNEQYDDIIFADCQNGSSMVLGGLAITTYKYCPYCGKKIKQRKTKWQE